MFDARDRRAYEQELLRARQEADRIREEADRAREEADRERDRVQHLVTTLQRSLLPPVLTAIPGINVAAYYHAASPDEVGGDFYDLFPLSKGQWGVFLGDVCGKGAGAAAVTSLTRYTLRSAAVYDNDPLAVLHNLNTVLNHEYHGDDPRFCTVVFGLITPTAEGCSITLASGGHPPSLVLRNDGSAETHDTPGGQLVGALADAQFVSTTVELNPGDTILLYSDGLTADSSHTRYGEDALLRFVTALAPTTAPALVDEIQALLADFGDGLDDDAAVLALSVPARAHTWAA